MAKKVDPAKAKAARQKKIAIVLGVVFVAVLAFQVPRTLKMLEGPPQGTAAAPAPAATTTTAAAGTPAAGTPAAAVPAAAAGSGTDPAAQPAVLADTDLAPAAGDGQLLSFEQFASKDPFKQQAVVAPPPAEGEGEGEDPPADAPAEEPPTRPAGGEPGSGAVVGSGGGARPAPVPATPSTPTTPAAPAVPAAPAAPAAPASATSIAVNGTAEDVALQASFPAADPTFVLVSEAADGKSVQIGVAGGAYADGRPTIKLELRKPLTLQNTADGSRFTIELRAVRGFVPPATR